MALLVALSIIGFGAAPPPGFTLKGNISAKAPNIQVGQPTATFQGLGNYLTHKATVVIPISNSGTAATTGDAYDVKVTAISSSSGGSATPLPQSLGNIVAGGGSGLAVTITNMNANATYTITTTVTSKDALDGAAPTVVQSRSFKTPVLPSL